MSIDCPRDCSYLLGARRYEAEHQHPIDPREVPFPEVHLPSASLNAILPLLSAAAGAVLQFSSAHGDLLDADVIAAVHAQAEAFRTLDSGLYYENPPPGALAGALYRELSKALEAFQQADRPGSAPGRVLPYGIFTMLVFLLRIGKVQGSPRPRSRAFLDFLRKSFPSAARIPEESPRIIYP